jgi:hypothetical protein
MRKRRKPKEKHMRQLKFLWDQSKPVQEREKRHEHEKNVDKKFGPFSDVPAGRPSRGYGKE